MKKIITFTFCLLTVVKTLNAQKFEWAKSIGGTAYDEGNSIIADASGNIYRSSWFGGGGSCWSLTGNAGLSSSFGGAVNYLGSSDDNDVVFKRNNIEIFRF